MTLFSAPPKRILAGRLALVALLMGSYWYHAQSFIGSSGPAFRLLLISLLLIPVSWYFFILVRRFFGTILPGRSLTVQEGAALLVSAAVLTPAMDIFSTALLGVLHVVVLALLMEGIRLVTRILGVRAAWWELVCRSGCVPLFGAVLLFGYGWMNIHHAVPVYYTITAEKALPKEGYKVVFLSDLHFANATTNDQLTRYAEAIGSEKPDLVILGGDIVDERSTPQNLQDAFRILGGIRSTFGTYYIYGNHDKAKYAAHPPFTVGELDQAITKNGIRILEDRSVVLAPDLTLTGRMDRSDPMRTGIPRAPSADLMAGLPAGAFHILADHQPRYFEENDAAGYDLMLSGHTHSGQIWPAGLLIKALDKGTILYGHEKRGRLDVLVSSGIAGWGFPVRTEGQSEYEVITIRPKE